MKPRRGTLLPPSRSLIDGKASGLLETSGRFPSRLVSDQCLVKDLPNPLSVGRVGARIPTRHRSQIKDQSRHEVAGSDVLSASSGRVLACSVEPLSGHRPSSKKLAQAVGPGPLPRFLDQPLLVSVGKQVHEPTNLSLAFLGDNDRLVPAAPEPLLPANETPSLPREIRVEIGHELGKSPCVRRRQQEVVVVGQEDEGMNVQGVPLDRPGQDPVRNRAQAPRGTEEMPPLEGSTSDLDKGTAGWNVAKSSSHANKDEKQPPPPCESAGTSGRGV